MQTPLEAWVHGWAISRATAAPVRIPTGYRIDVGLPGPAVRYVLSTYDANLVAGQHQPDTWLKICSQVSLDPPWQVQPAEYLMTNRLSETPAAIAPPYRLQTVRRGSVVDVVVWTEDGTTAARGKAALIGQAAVFDQIETNPRHRRRGLGRAVMRALSVAAQYAGATTGVLVATEDGRALYSALGWTLSSPVTAAVSRG
jgi:ribosomal protein S18 acetylase RimI-like enzyme